MRELTADEKPKKKISNKRTSSSAPHIPVKNNRARANDIIFEPFDYETKNQKKESDGKIAEGKKKPKGKKKLNTKEVDKILMEAKIPNQDENKARDYQFLIKKNIVKIMNVAKRGTEKDAAPAKTTGFNKLLHKAAADVVKKNLKEQELQITKSDQPKKAKKKPSRAEEPLDDSKQKEINDLKQKNLLRRAITATLPRRRSTPVNPRPQSSFVQQSENLPQLRKSIPALEPKTTSTKPKHKSSLQKIKNIFKAFKEPSVELIPPKVRGKAEELIGPKIVGRILPMPIGDDGPIVYGKAKKSKKPKSGTKAAQPMEKPSPRGKLAGKKKKKIAPEQILEAVVNA